jgi:branched-subunit amino acid aminotransferase/4-amino-4-deoxychorismate lyase
VRHAPVALIETIRVRHGEAPLWYLHLRRLAVSCKTLGIPLPGDLPPPSGGPDRVYRLEVGMRGVQVSERLVGPTSPVRLMVSRVTHHAYPYKTTDRAQFDRALDAARAAGFDDALLLTPGGFIAETAICSVLCW